VSVLLPDLIGVILPVALAVVGDLPINEEAKPGGGSFDGVTLECRFELLLDFKGVLSVFVDVVLFPGASVAKDDCRGWKVLADIRKSSGIASPL
jgi:hypothetical protein